MTRRSLFCSVAAVAALAIVPAQVIAQTTLNGVKLASGMYELVIESLPAGASRNSALVGMRAALIRGGTTVALAEALPIIAGVAIAATIGAGIYALIDPQGFARVIESITSGGIGDIFQIPLNKISTVPNGSGGGTSFMRATDFPAWAGIGSPYPDTNLDGWGLIYNSSDFRHRAYMKSHAQPLTAQDVGQLARAGGAESISNLLASGPLSEPAAQKALVAETIYQTALSVKAADPNLAAWAPSRPTVTGTDQLKSPISPNVWPDPLVSPQVGITPTPTPTPTPSPDVGTFTPPNLTVPGPREWWDRWLGGLAPTKPIVPAHQSACPVVTIPWFDGATHDFSTHCSFFTQSQGISRTVSTIGALTAAWRIVMEA